MMSTMGDRQNTPCRQSLGVGFIEKRGGDGEGKEERKRKKEERMAERKEKRVNGACPLETKREEERGLLATWVPLWLAVGVGKPLIRRMTQEQRMWESISPSTEKKIKPKSCGSAGGEEVHSRQRPVVK